MLITPPLPILQTDIFKGIKKEQLLISVYILLFHHKRVIYTQGLAQDTVEGKKEYK